MIQQNATFYTQTNLKATIVIDTMEVIAFILK